MMICKQIFCVNFIFILVLFLIPFALLAQGNWTQLNSGTTKHLNSISFLPYNGKGYAVGNNGTALRTLDFGDTWVVMNTETTEDLYSTFIEDGKFGYITGSNGTILLTIDGGDKWFKDTIPNVSTNLHVRKVHGVKSINEAEVYVIVNSNGKNLFCNKSGAFGVFGWDCDTLFGWPSVYDINGMYFINKSTGYLVGEPDAVFKTNDSGATWKNLSHILTFTIANDAYFFDEQKGFLAGASGSGPSGLYRTTDSANSWNPLIPSVKYLNAIDFYNNQYGIAAGYGTIAMSNDGGNSWNVDTTTAKGKNLNDAIYYNDSIAFVVGDSGTILKNTNISGVGFNQPEQKKSELIIYPNPFTDIFTIYTQHELSQQFLTFQLYDITGRKILEEKISRQTLQINTQKLLSGLYFYKLTDANNNSIRGKVVKN